MGRVVIGVTPFSYRVHMQPDFYLRSAHISIRHFLRPFTEMAWDYMAKRMVESKTYRWYDEATGIMYLPRYDLPRFENFLTSAGIEYRLHEIPCCSGAPIDFKTPDWYAPRNDLQIGAIDSIVNGTDPMRGLALQPGAGKSSVSLVAASRLGRRFMIKTPILLAQWEGVVNKFLIVEPDDVYVCSGSASIARLISDCDKTIHPKVILASSQTLLPYAKRLPPYDVFPPFTEFLNRINCGTVITDEAHLFFHSNMIIDMQLNPAVAIPMSATFEVTSKTLEPIYNGVYPPRIRWGEDKYERYVIVTSYTFDIPIAKIPKNEYRTFKGYNHTLYESDLLKKKPLLNRIIKDVYYPILQNEYFDYALPGEKLLIICARTEMCAYLTKMLTKDFPNKKVAMFIGGTPESVKRENDIIIATVKSSGVGFDVENLITTFVTVAADSPPLNKQLLGRLRKIKDRRPRLAYASSRSIESHRKYNQTRRLIFPALALKFDQHHLG